MSIAKSFEWIESSGYRSLICVFELVKVELNAISTDTEEVSHKLPCLQSTVTV